MEILNILYSNNLIAVYLIGAILVVILIFIVISSMSTTPKNNKEILKDPTEEDNPKLFEIESIKEEKIETPELPKINDIVENLYQKTITPKELSKEEPKNLSAFLEEFEVPENVIEEVIHTDTEEIEEVIETKNVIDIPEIKVEENKTEEIETPRLKVSENTENIEDMLKRLYDLRQNESDLRKKALLNEIYDLKKQVDESIKADVNHYTMNYDIDTKALADYYLFNEDIEFPKLK